MTRTRSGRGYVTGAAAGSALVLRAPLSFWGGLAVSSGEIISHTHPDCGEIVAGRILVLPAGKGSSSSSSVLAEAIRLGTAPSGIILGRPDAIMVIGCLVAQRLYGITVPMMVTSIDGITSGDVLSMACDADGESMVNWSSREAWHP